MLYPRGGNDRERRLESTCPLRHVCNASIAFFTVLFQRGEENTRRERERPAASRRFLDGIPERVQSHDKRRMRTLHERRRGHCSSASPRFLVVAVDRSGLNFLVGHATK